MGVPLHSLASKRAAGECPFTHKAKDKARNRVKAVQDSPSDAATSDDDEEKDERKEKGHKRKKKKN